ncbi:BA14K family protein [Agrobacterium vitis]
MAAGVPTQQAEIEQTRVAWCSDRYSSYRIEDNTYQPFGGGPRRACQAPQPVAGGAVAQASMPQATGDLAEAHVRWCFNRYSSYQAADNSYRAFSGVRRQCASPFADPASESLQASR